MTMLQQAAVQLPMWMGKASERYQGFLLLLESTINCSWMM